MTLVVTGYRSVIEYLSLIEYKKILRITLIFLTYRLSDWVVVNNIFPL